MAIKPLVVHLDPALHRALAQLALNRDTSMSALVRSWIVQHTTPAPAPASSPMVVNPALFAALSGASED